VRCRAGRRRGPDAEGSRASGIRHGGGFEYNCSCAAAGFASCMSADRRAKVFFAWPGFVWASRASASAVCADSSVLALAIWRSVGRSATGFQGSQRRPARRLMDEVSDQCCFISEVGHFSGRRNGAPAEWSGRKMAVLTTIADVLPVRSIAGYCWSWSGEASRPLVSCFSG
jgi:hypothetical protein